MLEKLKVEQPGASIPGWQQSAKAEQGLLLSDRMCALQFVTPRLPQPLPSLLSCLAFLGI